jgi:hypothetical protein
MEVISFLESVQKGMEDNIFNLCKKEGGLSRRLEEDRYKKQRTC